MLVKNKNSCDIILISPEGRKQQIYLPYALLFLSSYIEEKGFSTKIIDLKEREKGIFSQQDDSFSQYYRDSILNMIKEDSPSLIALTCYTSEYNAVMDIAKFIKANADVKIVAGGVHPTLMPQDFLFDGSPVDFVVVGDGETPLVKLLESFRNDNTAYKSTEGIAYFDSLKQKLIQQGCNIESDLSKFPMPDYSKIDMAFYTKPNIGNIRWLLFSGVSIFTGRGCPYSCEFCAVNFLRGLNQKASKMRYRSVDQVIEEIEFLKKEYHIDCFYVLDDCFMIDKERTKDFCKKLIERKVDLIWGAETRVNLFKEDDGLLALMKDAGLIQLDFGVESGSPAMLKEINKQITVEQTQRAFDMCKKHGIRTYANMLFNIPNETEKDIQLSYEHLKRIRPSVVGCGTTVPLLGSALYEKYVNPKLSTEEYELYNLDVYESIVDERFRLNKHNQDLTRIVRKLNRKYSELRTIPMNSIYWKNIFKSYHLKDYIWGYCDMLTQPISRSIKNIGRFFIRGKARKLFKSILRKS